MKKLLFILFSLVSAVAFGQFTKPQIYTKIDGYVLNVPYTKSLLDSLTKSVAFRSEAWLLTGTSTLTGNVVIGGSGTRDLSLGTFGSFLDDFRVGAHTINIGHDVSAARFGINSSGVLQIDVTSDATGDTYYRDVSSNFTRRAIGSDGYVYTVVSGVPNWAAPSVGLTNAAANNELAKSDGTNLVPSGIFSSTAGSAILGSSSISGDRTVSVASSSTNASLTLTSKGSSSVFANVNGVPYDLTRINEIVDATTSRTITESDGGKTIKFTNAGSIAVTLANSLPPGLFFTIVRETGAGTITVSAAGTLKVYGGTAVISTDYLPASFWHEGSNVWFAFGTFGTPVSGTVTSITLTQPSAGLTITGSGTPITSTGTPTFALANDLAALEGLSSTGFLTRTTTDTYAQRTHTGTTNRLTVTNGDGVSGNPTYDISATFEALLSKVANRIDQNNSSTTSAQLATVISDETGTPGFVMYSISPTTTGTFTGAIANWSGLNTFAVSPSAPQNTTSERYGLNATAQSFTYNTLIGQSTKSRGNGATITGYGANSYTSDYVPSNVNPILDDYSPPYFFGGQAVLYGAFTRGAGVAVGYGAVAKNREATAIGQKAYAPCLACIAIGDGARAMPALDSLGGGNEIVMGDASFATGNVNYMIGGGGGLTHDFTACFACQGQSTTFNASFSTKTKQLLLGAYANQAGLFNSGYISEFVLGPVTAAEAENLTLLVNEKTGTNVVGPFLTIKSGRGTGTGTPGGTIFQVGTTGTSGSTQHVYRSSFSIEEQGTTTYPQNTNAPGMHGSVYGATGSTSTAVLGLNLRLNASGSFVQPTGSSASLGIGFSTFSENRTFFTAITSGGTATHVFSIEGDGTGATNLSGGQFKWSTSATTARTTVDTGLKRSSAGVIAATNGSTGLGQFATMYLTAGTTAAATAPLKFTTGTSMTSAEAGAVEYTTDDLFFTIATGTARKRFLFADAVGGLTAGRLPYVGTNGRLLDEAALTYDATTDGLTVGNITSGNFSGTGSISATRFLQATGTSAGSGQLALYEDTDDGSENVVLKAGVMSANYTLILPSGLPSVTSALTTTSGGTMSTIAIADGTYTPTLTNTTNIAASTAYVTGYYRIGSSVTVYGKIDIDATLAASTATEIQIALPVASNMTGEEDLGGTAISDAVASLTARIKADATTDRASVVFKALSLTNDSYSFEFSYQVK